MTNLSPSMVNGLHRLLGYMRTAPMKERTGLELQKFVVSSARDLLKVLPCLQSLRRDMNRWKKTSVMYMCL